MWWCIQKREQTSRCNGRHTEQRCCQSWTQEPAALDLLSPEGTTQQHKTHTNTDFVNIFRSPVSGAQFQPHLRHERPSQQTWTCQKGGEPAQSRPADYIFAKILKLPDLEDVFSRGHISDVNPLTVDVGVVGVIATRTQTLCPDKAFGLKEMCDK